MTQPQDPYQPWPQQPGGPQHAPPPPGPGRSWPARHKVLTGIGGGLGALILISIIAGAASGGTKTVTVPGPTVTVTETASAAPQATASKAAVTAPSPSPTEAPPKPSAHTVATFSGSGQQNTPRFTVTATWKLKYSFDCSSFGSSGNFQVYEDGGNDFAMSVNDLASGKSSSTYAYDDAGTHYLEINSECSWSVKVIDEPGT